MSHANPQLPVVALVGRPNVGKSTLFNRIAGRRVAIVLNTPGVTRDRRYLEVAWGRLHFQMVDTGGVDMEDTDELGIKVGQQSLRTLREAQVVILLTDARQGLTPADRDMVTQVRRAGLPVIHLLNKCDTETVAQQAVADSHMGFDHTIPLSAEHGRGLDELYDTLTALLPEAVETEPPAEEDEFGPDAADTDAAEADEFDADADTGADDLDDGDAHARPAITGPPRVAVVGRPNVGKSTLINRLLGEDRLVVSDIPGTTRDAIDTELTWQGRPYLFIDTAGIRRRGRIEKGVERASIQRAMEALEHAEVAVLLMDATEGATVQDTRIAGLILDSRRACVLGINKWDLWRDNEEARRRIIEELERHFPFLAHAPTVYLSGQTGFHLNQLFAAIDTSVASYRRRIGTGELNREVERLFARRQPPVFRGRAIRIYYATQIGAAPPRFALFTSSPEGITEAYRRYLENGLREAFGFAGVPLSLAFRHRNKEKRAGQGRKKPATAAKRPARKDRRTSKKK
ncbi:MAG: ribosome biogenesis GTPase Der [Nitrospirota bacterium]|nr:ribosome biogenesis GTPase Der [Nitrospirota bacterium]